LSPRNPCKHRPLPAAGAAGRKRALFAHRPHGAGKAIRLSVKPDLTGIGSEGYLFTAGPAGVEIAATTEAGVFYGVQTLRQLLPLAEESRSGQAPTIPCLEIRDAPRFAWRGMMLDVARHFFDVDTVKQLLDALALLKMNVLHLHLCDDQGWRLEIERYPRLIEIGSTRPETQVGGFLSRKTDGLPTEATSPRRICAKSSPTRPQRLCFFAC